MHIVFRADASLQIGTGHVVRCLTLAESLRAHDATCHFICREHTGHLIKYIRQRGFTVSALPQCFQDTSDENTVRQPPHTHWLGCNWETDARQTGKLLSDIKPDWLVVDHYALDIQWERMLQSCYKKLLLIDDLADRRHACDILIDQNLGRKALDYTPLVPDDCTVMVGPQFALLRPDFAALRKYSLQRRVTPAISRLLITMGGVDQPNATGTVLETLKNCPLPSNCRISVIMGAQAPWIEQINTLAITMPWPTEVRINIQDMPQVMADSDLVISASGTTSWECCCLGLPTLLVVLANNQWAGARALHNIGAVRLLGEPSSIQEQLPLTILALMNEDILAQLSISAQSVTDGQGLNRVIKRMEQQT